MTSLLTAMPAPAADHRWRQLRRFVARGLKTAVAALPLAVLLWVLFPNPFASHVVFTLCISVSCWFVIDGTRILVALFKRRGGPGSVELDHLWPGWNWMVPIVIVGSVVGYAFGNATANALLGLDVPGPFDVSLREAVVLFVLAIVPASVITYVFYARERLAAQSSRVEQAERQAAEQRLKLIESQLDPHMLFNTLATVRALTTVDPAGAQAMLDRLIGFLRASLAGSRTSVHPLRTEVARLADYLALMQVRMGRRLRATLDIPADTAFASFPTFLLQPLVENSLRHGLEPQRDGGRIEVAAVREGDVLVVRVRDSGVGVGVGVGVLGTGPLVPRIGFGLGHVKERLATLYGDGATFSIEPIADADGGTLVTVRLPFTTIDANDANDAIASFPRTAPVPGPAPRAAS